MAHCKLIRVSPDNLRQASGSISSVAVELQQLSKELMRCANDAPSYEGQFGPVVTMIGLAALSGAKIHTGRFEGQSASLARRAALFEAADNAAVEGMKVLSPINVAYLEYLKKLSALTGIPLEQLIKILRLGGLLIPSIFLPFWIIWIGINGPLNPNPVPGLRDDQTDEGKSPFGELIDDEETDKSSVFGDILTGSNGGATTTAGTSPFVGGVTVTGGWGVYFNGTKVHNGIDLKPKDGVSTTIFPVGPGKVVKVVGSDTGYGNYVVIEHQLADGRTIYSTYAHMSAKSSLKVGDEVTSETKIGVMGSSGNSTGAHLHLDIYEKGKGSWDYHYQVNNYETVKPTDTMPSGVTYLDRMKDQWIDPQTVIDGGDDYQFLPVDKWLAS